MLHYLQHPVQDQKHLGSMYIKSNSQRQILRFCAARRCRGGAGGVALVNQQTARVVPAVSAILISQKTGTLDPSRSINVLVTIDIATVHCSQCGL